MANYDTGSDILSDILTRASEPTNGTSDYEAAAKRYIQQAYWDIYSWARWGWNLKYPPGVFQTVDKATGTATVTKGSATVTLGASIATSMAGRKFQIDNEGVAYRVSTHTAGTATLTLDVVYTEASGSAQAFTIYQDEYQLATGANGVIKPYRFWYRNRPDTEIRILTAQDQGRQLRYGSVYVYDIALITNDRVRVRPWPEEAKTIEYDYSERQSALTFDSTANDTPAIPVDDRVVIAYLALAWLETDKNRPDKAAGAFSLAKGKIDLMLAKYLPQQIPQMRLRQAHALGAGT